MSHPDIVNLGQGSIKLNVNAGGTIKTSSNLDFSTQLRKVMSQSAHLASKATSAAAPLVPGASVMSAVLSDAASSLAYPENSIAGMGGFKITGSGGNFLQSFEEMQQNMMSMNMQMIGVQRQFQQMSEQYTLASNVLKTKHDAEKNAISNIR